MTALGSDVIVELPEIELLQVAQHGGRSNKSYWQPWFHVLVMKVRINWETWKDLVMQIHCIIFGLVRVLSVSEDPESESRISVDASKQEKTDSRVD